MRLKRLALALTLIALTGAAALIVARLSGPTARDLDRDLQAIVSDLVRNNSSIRNCVLAVASGDGAPAWSGAAGIARRQGQVPMTADTPIFIASVTKLYTATVIMLLHERGALSVADPMAKFLPEALIRRINAEDRDLYISTWREPSIRPR